LANDTGIFKIVENGKDWADDVDKDKGNYDYLMFSNLDFTNQEVQDDVKSWGEWVVRELSLSGFRLDAVRHVGSFYWEFLSSLSRIVFKKLRERMDSTY
jgi:alpha-amylase